MAVNCFGCGGPLPDYPDPEAIRGGFHVSCMRDSMRDQDAEYGAGLRRRLIDIILDAETNSPRSLQPEIGPSELGTECDRAIGYRLARIPRINFRVDPWAAIVGTAIHAWLEKAILRHAAKTGEEWLTERTLQIDPFIIGHSDLYVDRTVIDHKSMSADKMRKVAEAGWAANPKYIVQAHIYGYGYEQAGFPVERVALFCVPRAGRIRDSIVIVEPYDRRIARYALDRMYQILALVVSLHVYENPKAWEQIPAVGGDDCGLCPWFDANRLTGADGTGCPGR